MACTSTFLRWSAYTSKKRGEEVHLLERLDLERKIGIPQAISNAIPNGDSEVFSLCTEIIHDDISHQSMARGGDFGVEYRQWFSSRNDTQNQRELYYAGNGTGTLN